MIGDAFGFIYLITDLDNGRKYVGKKFFWKPSKRMVKFKNGRNAAGKVSRAKRILVESDWHDYYSSNATISRIAADTPERFRREILAFGSGKGELAYIEAKEQFSRQVLLDDTYYNEIINLRVNARGLKNLKLAFQT